VVSSTFSSVSEGVISESIECIHNVVFVDADGNHQVSVKDGEKVTAPEAVGKAGYIFVGWKLNGYLFSFDTPIKSDIVLEADYELTKTFEILGTKGISIDISSSEVISLSLDDYISKGTLDYIDFAVKGEGLEITFDGFRGVTIKGKEKGDFSLNISIIYGEKEIGGLTLPVTVYEDSSFQVTNGGFEKGTTEGWKGTDGYNLEDGYVISGREFYFDNFFPNNIPSINKDGGYYLDGYIAEEGKQLAIVSADFVVNNDGWISFKMAGNNIQSLNVQLVEKGETASQDRIIQTFTNWKFDATYHSLRLNRYAYQISKEYIGKTCYFKCNAFAQDFPFASLNLDSFNTCYSLTEAPVIDYVDTYPAGFLTDPSDFDKGKILDVKNAPSQLLNGDFETGDLSGWLDEGTSSVAYTLSTNDQYFEKLGLDPVPTTNKEGTYFLDGFSFINNVPLGEAWMGTIYSKAFKVSGSGFISFLLGGNNNEKLQLQLWQYHADRYDTLLAQFTNWNFSDPYFGMGMTKYGYQIAKDYLGSICYFVIQDKATDTYGALTLDSVMTDYAESPSIDGKILKAAGYLSSGAKGADVK
jgi:hypothetical protein